MEEEDSKKEGKINNKGVIKSKDIPILQKAICKFDGAVKGTGFYLKIPYKEKYIMALLTCNHVLKIDKNLSTLYYYNRNEKKHLDLKDRPFWESKPKELDYTCIQILEKDNIKDFLEIDKNILNENYPLKNIQSIQIFNYDYEQSVGEIQKQEEEKKYIRYDCNTDKGWSGAPVLTNNCLLIGVHNCYVDKGTKVNKGINIRYIINDIIRQIEEDNSKKKQ